MKLDCCVVRDLLPLYVENMVSDQTAEQIKQHLAECSDCQWSMFCQRCPGLLCSESGHPEKISPNLCQTAENLYKLYHKRLSQEE